MGICTRTGDDGSTSLAGGKRVPKFSLRVEACGSVDELTAWIGLLRDHTTGNRKEFLIKIQDQLMRCACTIAADPGNSGSGAFNLTDPGSLEILEAEIDRIEAELPKQTRFIIPGGHYLVSYCHIARCVCRRVERAVLRLKNDEEVPDLIPKFLNRLSDYLYLLSRVISLELDIQENIWTI